MQTIRGYSLGAVDYILSPMVPEILQSKVKVFVDLHRDHVVTFYLEAAVTGLFIFAIAEAVRERGYDLLLIPAHEGIAGIALSWAASRRRVAPSCRVRVTATD